MPILRPEEIRQLPERHALVVAENAKPLIARLSRCMDGKPGKALLAAQAAVKQQVNTARTRHTPVPARTAAAVAAAQRMDLTPIPASTIPATSPATAGTASSTGDSAEAPRGGGERTW